MAGGSPRAAAAEVRLSAGIGVAPEGRPGVHLRPPRQAFAAARDGPRMAALAAGRRNPAAEAACGRLRRAHGTPAEAAIAAAMREPPTAAPDAVLRDRGPWPSA